MSGANAFATGIPVSGSKFKYVRLVTGSNSVKQPLAIAPAPSHSDSVLSQGQQQQQNQPLKLSIPTNQYNQVLPKQLSNSNLAMVSLQQQAQHSKRILLPAGSNPPANLIVHRAPAVSTSLCHGPSSSSCPTNLPTCTDNLSMSQLTTSLTQTSSTVSSLPCNSSAVQPYTLISVPTRYLAQSAQQPGPTVIMQSSTPVAPKQEPSSIGFVPLTENTSSLNISTTIRNDINGGASISNSNSSVPSTSNSRLRKPCNCTKSQCLKLYCDCFANGEFCQNCNCNNCSNNLEHSEERQRAIKSCLDRNPHAFHPKIGKGRVGGDRQHNKGCNCKRSGCLKNYCECYEAKILCSNLCKCNGCKNYEESPERQSLAHGVDSFSHDLSRMNTSCTTKSTAPARVRIPNNSVPEEIHSFKNRLFHNGERLPHTFVTADVAEATMLCLLAQAEDSERHQQTEINQEHMILEEFGRCLLQVIQSSTHTRAESPLP